MKVRKLAVALALAGGLGSGVAQALGLGEIELQSYLNEPLEADISLTKSDGVSPSEVFVNLASDAAYRQVGIDRGYFLNRLKFNVTTAADGNLVVNVSTTEPVREPYLNFLLEVTWPSGRLMREYALLIDPPVYSEESGVTEQVQAPTVAPAPAPAPRQATSPTPRAETAATSPRRGAPTTFGPTGPADTLWAIASAVKPNNSVSNQQVMLAIQDLNPDAFIGGNINRLKRGQVLRVPTLDQIQQRTRAQATNEVSLQNQALSAPATRAVDAREEAPAEAPATQVTAPAASGGDELKLLVADAGAETGESESGSAGGDSQLAGGVDSGSSVALEELDSTRRENEELSGRVEDLQAQVETLQRLLELKNSQLAEFEQSLAAEDQAVPGPVAEDEVMAAGEADGELQEAPVDAGAGTVAEGEETAGLDATEGDALAMTPEEGGIEAEGEAEEMPVEAVATDEVSAPTDMESGDMAEAGMAGQEQPVVPEDVVEAVADEQPAPQAVVGADDQAPQAEVAQPAKPEAAEKSFPQNIIDAIVNNPLYQIALGGGLVLFLLLMLLIARRNANKEKAFYDDLNKEAEGEEELLDLGAEEAVAAESGEAADPLAEADTYIAYGRLDQAAHSLEAAISKEPSRTDLRLKLLGVYADSEDRTSFEKQFGELEALDDDDATAQATALRSRLEEAEAAPSIDDLESQLMSDSFSAATEEPAEVAEEESLAESEESALDFADLELDEFQEGAGASEEESAEVSEVPEVEQLNEDVPAEEAPIEFDLSDIELEEPETELPQEGEVDLEDLLSLEEESELAGDELDLEFEAGQAPEELAEADLDLGSLEQDLGSVEDAIAEPEDELASLDLGEEGLEVAEESANLEEVGGEELLDESFLDELDAELDKVSADEGEDLELADDSLGDLELDISDEDLALMGEVAGEDLGASEEAASEIDVDLEAELGEELESGEELASEQEVPVAGEVVEDLPSAEEPQAEITEAPLTTGLPDLDEAALGDDDDFDFLAGTDEAATKLDLARAYIEMGDADGARDILEEVAIEGNDEQKVEAQDLLKSLS